MKSLVIAEKPSVARDIARVLHCSQKGNGTLEGKDYVVTWALGHLVTWQIRKNTIKNIPNGNFPLFL